MYRKKVWKIRAILCHWKTADRIETGFSLENRPKRVENTPGFHHERSYWCSRDIRLQFTPVWTILKMRFPYTLNMFSIHSWKQADSIPNMIKNVLTSLTQKNSKVLKSSGNSTLMYNNYYLKTRQKSERTDEVYKMCSQQKMCLFT